MVHRMQKGGVNAPSATAFREICNGQGLAAIPAGPESLAGYAHASRER